MLIQSLGKLSSMVRSVAHNDSVSHRSSQNTPTPWDYQAGRDRPQQVRQEEQEPEQRDTRGVSNRDSRGSQRERIERLGFGQQQQQQPPPPQQPPQQQQQHVRNGSGTASSADFNETQNGTGRRHDYDFHAMETDLNSPRSSAIKNPIPAPVVTVRSEFPTLNRSRQQQSLTCLVTIEVAEGKWHPSTHDLQHAPPAQSLAHDEVYNSVKSPVRPARAHQIPEEVLEALEETTEELKARVDNWHGLEFERSVSQLGTHVLSAKRIIDLANCAFMALSASAKIFNPGRSLSAIYLMKCSSASKKRRVLKRSLLMAIRNER